MASIGTFKFDGNKYMGEVRTLTLCARMVLVPSSGGGDRGPDYRAFAGKYEVGAGWNKTSQQGRAYVQVRLDDPVFPAPVFGNLIQREEGGEYVLLWHRSDY